MSIHMRLMQRVSDLDKELDAERKAHVETRRLLADACNERLDLIGRGAQEAARAEKAEALNEYFRNSVGECHLMISRNTPEFQVQKEWEAVDLPARLQVVMLAKEKAERERDEAIDQTVRNLVELVSQYQTNSARAIVRQIRVLYPDALSALGRKEGGGDE